MDKRLLGRPVLIRGAWQESRILTKSSRSAQFSQHRNKTRANQFLRLFSVEPTPTLNEKDKLKK